MCIVSTDKKRQLEPEVITGIMLIGATILALIIANTPLEHTYHYILSDIGFGEFNLHLLINDFLMAIFFLIAGGEIKHEILHGNLSTVKKASFPVLAAIGGVAIPALIYALLNMRTEFAIGAGIPISTDIAFAVGIYMIFKNKLNPNLKVFLLSLAVVDDLISIIVIGVAYSSDIRSTGLLGAAIVIAALWVMANIYKLENPKLYILPGLILWLCIFFSGVHATISGVILAALLPTESKSGGPNTLERTLHALTPFSNYVILPLFAFANTGINLNVEINFTQVRTLISGIILGLSVGKPVGIFLFTYLAEKFGFAERPPGVSWFSIFQVGILAGIGFTMSIFVSQLAFSFNQLFVDVAKISILLAVIISIILTFVFIGVDMVIHKKAS